MKLLNQLRKAQKELKNEGVKLKELANILTETRKIAASRFSEELMSEAKHLGMQNIKFSVVMSQGKMGFDGQDNVEFISTFNKNQEMQPISKVASGGEMSRIMLCVKSIVGSKMQMPTIIFDEIDTGVSGRAALKVASKLKQVSCGKQVLCVTHLGQLMAYADSHYLIEKAARDGKTYTSVTLLDMAGRKGEIARITGGGTVTDIQLANAEQMIMDARSEAI